MMNHHLLQEIREFMKEVDRQYGLQLQVLSGDFKAGLEHLVAEKGVRAIFLGTRRWSPCGVLPASALTPLARPLHVQAADRSVNTC